MVDRDLLQELTETYLRGVVLEAFEAAEPPLDPAEHPFDSFTPFREFGIDSFLVLKILRRLEKDFGTLPKTLLFENFNICDLANYFADKHMQTLSQLFAEQLQDAGVPSLP
ncbi:MAG: acyl carrier protein [Dokdonella sp.]